MRPNLHRNGLNIKPVMAMSVSSTNLEEVVRIKKGSTKRNGQRSFCSLQPCEMLHEMTKNYPKRGLVTVGVPLIVAMVALNFFFFN